MITVADLARAWEQGYAAALLNAQPESNPYVFTGQVLNNTDARDPREIEEYQWNQGW